MKVTIVGAGNVGATCADVISYRGIASEVVLLDIKEGFAEGKALDIMQCATNTGFNTKVSGVTNDYSRTAGSDVVVIFVLFVGSGSASEELSLPIFDLHEMCTESFFRGVGPQLNLCFGIIVSKDWGIDKAVD